MPIIPGIVFLRSLACMMVFVSHAFYYSSLAPNIINSVPWWVTGFLGGSGVAIFFAISGYLIINIANRVTPSTFIFDRFLRIFPGFWLAILLYLYTENFDISLINWQSFFLIPIFNNFNSYNIPAWTLFYEIQFYLFVYLLLLINCVLKINFSNFIYFISLIWLNLILLYCLTFGSDLNSQTPGFYIFFSSMNLGFIGGIFSEKFNILYFRKNNYINLLIACVLHFLSLYIEPSSNRIYPNIILALAGIFTLIFFINSKFKFPFPHFADKSYGIYLVHIIFLDIIIVLLSLSELRNNSQLIWLILLLLTAFVPSYYFGFLENKLHQMLKRFVRKF